MSTSFYIVLFFVLMTFGFFGNVVAYSVCTNKETYANVQDFFNKLASSYIVLVAFYDFKAALILLGFSIAFAVIGVFAGAIYAMRISGDKFFEHIGPFSKFVAPRLPGMYLRAMGLSVKF